MTIELLPHKEFVLNLNSGTIIKGQFALWSVKRFCDKKKLALSQLESALKEDTLSFDDLCLLLLCAVEYVCRTEKQPFTYTDIDACNWIEEMGGLLSDDFNALMKHSGSEEEKKSATEPLLSGEI